MIACQAAQPDRAAERASSGTRWRDKALIAYARSLEHPAKIRLIRWMVARLAGGRIRICYAAGATIEVDPADYIGWEIFTTGLYEPATLALALRIMTLDPGVFVDVGANFGWYTCAVAAAASARIVSIEPDCDNCASLRRNIALSGVQDVVVFNGAIAADFGIVQMIRRARGNAGTVAVHSGESTTGSRQGWVATMPLEALLKRVITPAARPVLIKVDVEGFEQQVFAGLDFEGPFRPKNILLEFDGNIPATGWQSFGDLQTFFAARGYELFDVLGQPLRSAEGLAETNIWARERPLDVRGA